MTLVQQASASTRPRTGPPSTSLAEVAAGRPKPDLVVLPEAFARDFGSSGIGRLRRTPRISTARSSTRLADLAAEQDLTVVAGMFERSDDPGAPVQHPRRRAARTACVASYRKIHLYDSFGYRESDRLLRRAGRAGPVDVAGLRVGLMTCYDLRFPEMARALVDRGADLLVVPAAWVAGERKVDALAHAGDRARAIENTVYVAGRRASRDRATPATRMVVAPSGDVLVELGDADESGARRGVLAARLLDEVRATNPSLANRRM